MSDTAHPSGAPTRRVRLAPRHAVAAVAAGLVLCVLAARFSGATAPLQLMDPGTLVRWGLPTVRVVSDIAMALTIGALLLGGLLVPEGARSRRRARCAAVAGRSALVWAFAGALEVVLGYADLAGRRLTEPGFWSACWQTTWQLEILRAPAITVLVAIVVAVCALGMRPGRNGQAWLFFVALAAVLPLSLVGHAAGSAAHDTAVNSLLVHLVAVSLWVGGVLALVVLWRGLGRAGAVAVARFSRVATWCYVAVGVSGILNAAVRLGGWGGLDTRYGVLVIGKAALLVVLGGFGYVQRRRMVAALLKEPTGKGARRHFARFAGVEVLVMGTAVGLATALARSAPPVPEATLGDSATTVALTGYPAPAPLDAMSWFTQWRLDWLFTAIALIGIGVYVSWVVRLRRRGDRWPWIRLASWCAGWLVFCYMVDGAPGIYGRVMFSSHMLGHMVISMFVPILLVRGGVITLALRALPRRDDETLGPRELLLAVAHSRFTSIVANPVVAGALTLGTLILFYYSPFFELALRTHTGHLLMTAHFMLVGYAFAWSLVGIDPGPKRWPVPLRLGILLITVAFHAFFGVALMTGTTLLAPDFFTALHYVAEPIVDQQRAGTIAWGSGEIPTLLLTLILAFEWARRDQAEARRYERQAARDGDAELRAYNEYLATRNRAPGRAKERS